MTFSFSGDSAAPKNCFKVAPTWEAFVPLYIVLAVHMLPHTKCNSINIYKHYYKHVWICLLWTIWNFLNHRTLPWESIGIISVVEIQQCTTHSAGGKTVAKDPFKFWALAKYRVQTFFGGLLSLLNILFSADMYGAVNLLYWGNTVKDKQVYFYTGHLPSTGNNEIYHIQSEKNHHVWKIVVITQHSLLI